MELEVRLVLVDLMWFMCSWFQSPSRALRSAGSQAKVIAIEKLEKGNCMTTNLDRFPKNKKGGVCRDERYELSGSN